MNYDCNVRSRNTMLQVRKSVILVSHRIELPHIVLLYGARDERRKAVVSNEISSTSRLPSFAPRAALCLWKCIRSKRQAGSCVAHISLLSGTRCSRDVHPWSRSLSRDSPGGNRHKQDVEEDCRSPLRTAFDLFRLACRLCWEQRTFAHGRSRLVPQLACFGAATQSQLETS
jgi:hypothetical protein